MTDQNSSAQVTEKDAVESEAAVHLAVRQKIKSKSTGRQFLLASLVLVLGLLLGLIWVVQTQAGGRFFLHSLSSLSGGKLTFSPLHGRLADQLQIDEVVYQDAQKRIRINGLQLNWQLWSILSGRLAISQLNVSTLRVASQASTTPAVMPVNLQLPINVAIQQAAIGRIVISELSGDGQEIKPIELKSVLANLQTSNREHQIAMQFDSAWGGLHLKSAIQTVRPFSLGGTFTYHGQLNQDLPKVLVQGNLTGSLQALSIQARSVTATSEGLRVDPQQQASADLDLHLSPFSTHPIDAAHLKVLSLNPQWINQHAPFAMLDIDVNLQPRFTSLQPSTTPQTKVSVQSPVDMKSAAEPDNFNGNFNGNLDGTIRIVNRAARTIDQHGLPFKLIESGVDWHDMQLNLAKTKIELLAGSISAQIKLQLRAAKLPLLDSKLVLKDLNLAQIDSRMRESRIQGEVQLQAKAEQGIDFQAQLTEPRANLNAEASFIFSRAGDSGLLRFKRLELQAEQARLNASGEVHFDGERAFKMQAKMTQFDPAHWWLAPHGRIDGDIHLSGNLAGKTTVKLRIPSLTGELAGQKILAVGQADWQQSSLLKLDQLQVQWGSNRLSANGALGSAQSQLQLNLVADDLAHFESITGFSLVGKANAEAVLSGKLNAPIIKAKLHADDLRSAQGWALSQLNADVEFGMSPQDPLKIQVIANELKSASISLDPVHKDQQGLPIEKRHQLIEQLQLSMDGVRNQHTINARAQFDKARSLVFSAQGGLMAALDEKIKPEKKRSNPIASDGDMAWGGRLHQMQLTGFGRKVDSTMADEDVTLQAPMPIQLGSTGVKLGSAQLVGGFGKLALNHLEWTPKSLSSKAKWDGIPVMALTRLVKPQESLHGDLRLGLDWDLQLKDSARGEIRLSRQAGDLYVPDADGTGQAMSLGLSQLNLQMQVGGLIAGSDAEQVRLSMQSVGDRVGQWRANLDTQIQRVDDKWTFHSDAPMKGDLQATIPELQWLAGQLSADFAVKGALNLSASFGGKFSQPVYQATLDGRNLELAFASEGLLFPNGELRAHLNQDVLKLEKLRFANKVNFVPKLEQLQDLNWTGREGEFVASGEVNWREQTGVIQADWKDFPLLQRKDRWLVVSGQANIKQVDKVWALIGKLKADAAYFKLPKLPPPSLSSDVLVSRGLKLRDEEIELDSGKKGLKTKLDLQIDMGSRFVFVGRGLDTALTGTLRLRSNDNSPVYASGSIITNGGQYEGYGQQLEIERGILNFQGAPNNPALNIRALRKGLAVEAGVDVTGTVASPQVRLVSEPNVPDSEKISWLVLGRESDQVGTADASLLLSAAGAIFGGDGSRNIPRELVQGLGFDEFSIGPAENGGASKLPSQTVAGATSVGSSSNDKVVNIGKRLKPGLVISVERGVSDASGALKLSWQLTRRIRFIGRSGTDNSADVKYSFSFN